ncbi:MAG: accessory factor UbiK family protein [Gammaproteobacteria bacterium]|nr:accessory factor UbiK family protein [Gammaproteobacteria bacterium]
MNQAPIDDLARRLTEGLPAALSAIREDVERNFRVVLQSALGRLDLATRADFDVQARLLERAQQRVAQLEARVASLEHQVRELEAEIPPASD